MVLSIATLQSQFNISHLFAHSLFYLYTWFSILSGATTPIQNGPGSKGHEGIHHIPQISKAGTSLWDWIISYLGYLLEWSLTSVQRCNQCILQPQLTGLQSYSFKQLLIIILSKQSYLQVTILNKDNLQSYGI